ncbi:alpha/beta hydrolase [Marinomonas sp. 15G1-11]|uniref:Alpha/beta hydrolase n=1 Tax=Marinomonas phaeophyticola TaxID=3004091 RepID=A0ABT4JPW8_9GAMM|nr:alpha/beta hydrolase [Marinomonas sp. 15G1-11]MCZ2720432.1 alpha/beta hydrolase [Marinomonas sp. 15G1-11]
MPKEIKISLKHTSLTALEWKSENTKVVSAVGLHGWLDNAASFSELAPAMSNLSTTALDLSGHGYSDHRPDGSFYHLWDYALDVIEYLNTKKQSVWLIGHSMGGSVAMLVAALAPEKVRGLVVLDNIGPITEEVATRVTTMQRAIQRMSKFKKGNGTRYKTKEDMILARMDGFTKLGYFASSKLVDRGAIRKNDQWVWRHDGKLSFPSPYRMDEESVCSFIDKIICPSLLLIANDGIYKEQESLVSSRADYFSWVKLKWLDGGHHFHLEPDTSKVVAEEIKHFIDHN